MSRKDKLHLGRLRRHKRIRRKVLGTPQKPRLCVYRSLANLHVQVVDDSKDHTLLHLSTLDKEFKKQAPYGGNSKAAAALGEAFAKKAAEAGITEIIFDRGGFAFAGRIKAFAEGARKAGLKF